MGDNNETLEREAREKYIHTREHGASRKGAERGKRSRGSELLT